jgi:6-phospho-3-hexuloisomerase
VPVSATGRVSWLVVGEEVAGVLSAVSSEQMARAAALLTDCGRRWFCPGQGRSGLVAQMAAMRLMHIGFDAHAVGEGQRTIDRRGRRPGHRLGLRRDSGHEVPATRTRQFGGTLFEQSALLLLDGVIFDLTAGAPRAYAEMQARHANLE